MEGNLPTNWWSILSTGVWGSVSHPLRCIEAEYEGLSNQFMDLRKNSPVELVTWGCGTVGYRRSYERLRRDDEPHYSPNEMETSSTN